MNTRFFNSSATGLTSSNTDIIFALSTSDLAEVKKTVNKSNINKVIDTKNGFIALHYAVKFGDKSIIKYLMDIGSDPNIKTNNSNTSFDLSMKYQNQEVYDIVLNNNKEDLCDLNSSIVLLRREIVQTKTNNDFLIQGSEKLLMKNDILTNENKDLRKEITGIKDDRKSILSSNQYLTTYNAELIQKNTILTKETLTRKRKFEELESVHFSLEKKHASLEDSYAGLLEGMRKKK